MEEYYGPVWSSYWWHTTRLWCCSPLVSIDRHLDRLNLTEESAPKNSPKSHNQEHENEVTPITAGKMHAEYSLKDIQSLAPTLTGQPLIVGTCSWLWLLGLFLGADSSVKFSLSKCLSISLNTRFVSLVWSPIIFVFIWSFILWWENNDRD
jgi:hypothetical protein